MRKIEARFTKTVTRLRKLTDACLAQYLGSQILEKHIEETKGPILIDTIRLLRKLPLCILPGEKLDVVVNIFDDARLLVKNCGKESFFISVSAFHFKLLRFY